MPVGWIRKAEAMRSNRPFVSCFPSIGAKRETNGNETGNEMETKHGFLCRSGNEQETWIGNERHENEHLRFRVVSLTLAALEDSL